MSLFSPYTLLLIPLWVISLTVHEFSHALADWRLGDDTAKRAGRLTLNPLAHIDIFGLLVLLFAGFGWAKPVPCNPYNFRNYKRDMAITAAAGPASNLTLALLAMLFTRLYISVFHSAISLETPFHLYIITVGFIFVLFNLQMALFNLIPFPPLDGSKVIGGFLPDRWYFRYVTYEREGMMIFFVLIMIDNFTKLHIISTLIFPPSEFLMRLMAGADYDTMNVVSSYVLNHIL